MKKDANKMGFFYGWTQNKLFITFFYMYSLVIYFLFLCAFFLLLFFNFFFSFFPFCDEDECENWFSEHRHCHFCVPK